LIRYKEKKTTKGERGGKGKGKAHKICKIQRKKGKGDYELIE